MSEERDFEAIAAGLAEIAAEVNRCTACELHKGRTRAVPGEGPISAEIMFIGEAPGRNEEQIMRGVDDYLKIGGFLDAALKQQVVFDLNSFEQASGRELDEYERWEFRQQQLQANRWTYLGSGMTHEKVLDTLEWLAPAARQKVESVSATFC